MTNEQIAAASGISVSDAQQAMQELGFQVMTGGFAALRPIVLA